MSTPLVSVLMTAYNREKYIAAAIDTVLSSTYTNFELIICDDRSTDGTVEIAQRYAETDSRIRFYINEKNLGDYPNRNRAASYARGEYLKYLDSDDMLYPFSLQAFVDFMETDRTVAIGICSRKNNNTQPFPIILNPSESLRYHFFKEGFFDTAPTATIIRKEYFDKEGGFSGKRMIGDLEFAMNLASKYKVMLLPPGLFFWRQHGEQEIFIGRSDNMYPRLFDEVAREQFRHLPDGVLTSEEQQKILRHNLRQDRTVRLKKAIKRILGMNK